MDNSKELNELPKLFNAKLILFDVIANDSVDLLKKLSRKLVEEGYVKESYEQAIIERERVYPTGLPTQGVMVAIPHTDPEHVLKGGILVANLKNPVNFKEMGNGVNDIPAELVFMLAVDQPENQIKVLKKLIGMFMKKDVLLSIKKANDVGQVISILESQTA